MKLRELFEAKTKRIIAVMPGGFHPFHPGHKSLYDWAVTKFGADNVYVAATDDTKTRPFPFDVKQELAAMAGVPASRFMQVKSPFNALSYDNLLREPDKTALVFIRSEKDKTSHPLPDQIRKSDGNMGYLISYTDGDLETADTHGYIAYGPTIDFTFSGLKINSATQLRNTWPTMDPEEKIKASEMMYPGKGEKAQQLLDKALGAPIDESLNEVQDTLPDKIKVMKPQNPPKAPDATIPISRNGYTTDDGTTYKQDKYNDNLVHVSDGGGDYTFDGARIVKWKTPRMKGLQYTYDYVQRKIIVNFDTDVKAQDPTQVGTGTGNVSLGQSATYDFKGNKIADSGSMELGSGTLSTKFDKSGATVKDAMFDPFNDVTMIIKSNPEKIKKYGEEKLKKILDKDLGLLRQSSMGRAVPGIDYKKVTQRLITIADVSFRDANGKDIPASQAISGAQEWWDSLNKTNQDKNARIAKMRAPQKPVSTEK